MHSFLLSLILLSVPWEITYCSAFITVLLYIQEKRVRDYVCAFWNFSKVLVAIDMYWPYTDCNHPSYLPCFPCSDGDGGWASEGVAVVSNKSEANTATVVCNSTHLTSFAVLVDVAGGLEVRTESAYCMTWLYPCFFSMLGRMLLRRSYWPSRLSPILDVLSPLSAWLQQSFSTSIKG